MKQKFTYNNYARSYVWRHIVFHILTEENILCETSVQGSMNQTIGCGQKKCEYSDQAGREIKQVWYLSNWMVRMRHAVCRFGSDWTSWENFVVRAWDQTRTAKIWDVQNGPRKKGFSLSLYSISFKLVYPVGSIYLSLDSVCRYRWSITFKPKVD